MANPTPWKTNDWFVSEWNYAPEVTKDFKFAKNIKIHDVTLRDGEQQTGVILSKDEKIRIAEGLAEAGVHRIEAGMPIVSPSDNDAIKEIVKRNLGPQIFSFARCMKEDVKRAVDTGVKGVVMEIPSSKHMLELAYRWPLEKAIETSIEATSFAHKNGLEVVFFPIDFSRAELKWAIDLIEKVGKEGHMDALALVDTFGVLVAARHEVLRHRGAEAHQEAAGSALPPGLRHGGGQHHHGALARRRGDAHHRARHRRALRQHADGRRGDGAQDHVRRRLSASTPPSSPRSPIWCSA